MIGGVLVAVDARRHTTVVMTLASPLQPDPTLHPLVQYHNLYTPRSKQPVLLFGEEDKRERSLKRRLVAVSLALVVFAVASVYALFVLKNAELVVIFPCFFQFWYFAWIGKKMLLYS